MSKELEELRKSYDAHLATLETMDKRIKALEEQETKGKHPYDFSKEEFVHILYPTGEVSGPVTKGGLEKSMRYGSIFKTRKEAFEEAERRAVYRELQTLSSTGGKRDGISFGWYILYNAGTGGFYCDTSYTHVPYRVYFATREEANNAIKTVGGKRLKIFFGITED